MRPEDEREFFFETLAEYQWARDAAGLVPHTIDLLVEPVIEICEYYDTVPWKLEPKHLDRFFAGDGAHWKCWLLLRPVAGRGMPRRMRPAGCAWDPARHALG